METFHIILIIIAAIILGLIVFLEINRRKTQKEERSWMDIKHEIASDPLETEAQPEVLATEPQIFIDTAEPEYSIEETQELTTPIINNEDSLGEIADDKKPKPEQTQQAKTIIETTEAPDDQHEFDFPEINTTEFEEPTLGTGEKIKPSPRVGNTSLVEPETFHSEYEEVFALSVMAQDGDSFEGADLMREFTAQNLQFGEMGFYHRAMPGMKNINLFSVTNIMQPGNFDQKTIINLKTKGLLLFMRLPGKLEPIQAFDQFYDTADALAVTLSGKICDEHRNALSQHRLGQIRDKIQHLALKLELERKKSHKKS